MNTTNDFKYKWWALIGLSVLSFTAFLDYTIVVTALPFIQKAFHTNVLKLQWVMNAFAMVNCMLMIVVGRFGDIFGRRKVYYIGFAMFTIAAVGAGFSHGIDTLIFFRVIQGAAAAIIFTVGVALLPTAFPHDEQTRAVAVFSAFNGVGLAVGPFLSGLLITYLSWRWVFFINIPFIIVGLGCCSFSLKESAIATEKVSIDWWGLLLLIIGLGCLVFGIISGEQYGWGSFITWVNIAIGLIGLVLLIIVENIVNEPLLDLKVFKNHYVVLAILACAAASLVTMVLMFFDPLYLKIIRNETPMIIGIVLLAVPLMQVVISLTLEWLEKIFGIVNLLLLSLAFGTIAAVLQGFIHIDSAIWYVILAFLFMGTTWGFSNVGSIKAVMVSTPHDKTGGVMGTVFTFWNLSGSIFLAIATVIFHAREGATIMEQLAKHNVKLTKVEHHKIAAMIANPEGAMKYVSSFVGEKAHEVLNAFRAGFMSGFHSVAWYVAVFMAISLLVGLWMRPKKLSS